MARFLTSDDFIAQFGEAEAMAIAGSGDFNSLEGSVIDHGKIEGEIAFADELIAGYVLERHSWVGGLAVGDVPNLLKGFGGDIVRYRLRDKHAGKGQVSETVETRWKAALAGLKDIQAGRLQLPRDRADGADTATILPVSSDAAGISGPSPQADQILEGY